MGYIYTIFFCLMHMVQNGCTEVIHGENPVVGQPVDIVCMLNKNIGNVHWQLNSKDMTRDCIILPAGKDILEESKMTECNGTTDKGYFVYPFTISNLDFKRDKNFTWSCVYSTPPEDLFIDIQVPFNGEVSIASSGGEREIAHGQNFVLETITSCSYPYSTIDWCFLQGSTKFCTDEENADYSAFLESTPVVTYEEIPCEEDYDYQVKQIKSTLSATTVSKKDFKKDTQDITISIKFLGTEYQQDGSAQISIHLCIGCLSIAAIVVITILVVIIIVVSSGFAIWYFKKNKHSDETTVDQNGKDGSDAIEQRLEGLGITPQEPPGGYHRPQPHST